MKKFLFFIFLFKAVLFGCATCQLMVPSVELEIELKVEKKRLNNIHIQWHFSKIYSKEMLVQYDKNTNAKLDREELDVILNAILDYLKPKQMITLIKYADKSLEEAIVLEPEFKNFTLVMQEGLLLFSYDAIVPIELKSGTSLSFAFKDDESYFTFSVKTLDVNVNELNSTTNLYLFTASILFEEDGIVQKTSVPQVKVEPKESSQETVMIQEDETLQENFLKKSIDKIKSLFESIKDEKNPLTYLFLLFFAYIYGVIHALGPGHGKTLVASYFLSNERSYTKAFFISLAIGVLHTFSAFILTLVIYFLVNTFLAQFLDDTVYYTTKISALIIISIAIYLIYKKYIFYKTVKEEGEAPKSAFSTTPPHLSSCACSSCKVDKNSTDTALIISAGIIPCPGTTTIFIFAISMGLYYAGFISALVMSLGMSSVIFFSALLSTLVRKKALSTNEKLKKYLEFGSLIIIFILGVVLLFM